jgi:hypothetical protein
VAPIVSHSGRFCISPSARANPAEEKLIGVILSMAYTLAPVRDPAERAQLRWVAWGALVTCTGAIVGGVLGVLGQLGERPLLDFAAYRALIHLVMVVDAFRQHRAGGAD